MKTGDTSMSVSEREATRRRLQIWQEAQPLLEEQRWRELMALTDARALKLTESLLGRKGIAPVSRETSGLVDQQALFQRTRRR